MMFRCQLSIHGLAGCGAYSERFKDATAIGVKPLIADRVLELANFNAIYIRPG